MSDRTYKDPKTQGTSHVTFNFTLKAATVVTNPPTFVEGDVLNASSGSHLVATKVATGKYRFKTVDKFIGCVAADAWLTMASPDSNTYQQCKQPTQNADGTWQFELWVSKNTAGSFALVDVVAGDYINVQLVMRNSSVRP